jgi:hypothetical protein
MEENIAKKRKDDALELAYLIYDIFKEEEQSNDKIEGGQDYANQTNTN